MFVAVRAGSLAAHQFRLLDDCDVTAQRAFVSRVQFDLNEVILDRFGDATSRRTIEEEKAVVNGFRNLL